MGLADFDCDGQLEVVTVNPTELSLEVRARQADGFELSQTISIEVDEWVDPGAHVTGAGDFNGDGALDLAVARTVVHASLQFVTGVLVFLGDGRGQLLEPGIEFNSHEEGFAPQVMTVGDLDGDGLDDIAVLNVERDEFVVAWLATLD